MGQGKKRKRILQAISAGALMPLLSFCSTGDIATPAAVATPRAPAAPVVSGPAVIYINEVLAHTDEPQVDTLELYNPGEAAVNLAGWCVSDDKDDVRKYCMRGTNRRRPSPVIARRLLSADQRGTRLCVQRVRRRCDLVGARQQRTGDYRPRAVWRFAERRFAWALCHEHRQS